MREVLSFIYLKISRKAITVMIGCILMIFKTPKGIRCDVAVYGMT
jgi:hypothetical protein